MTNTQ